MPWLRPSDLEVRPPALDEAPQAAALWLEAVPDFAAAFGQEPARALEGVLAYLNRDPARLAMIGAAVHEGQLIGVCRLVRYPGRGWDGWRELRAYAGVYGWRAALSGMRRLRAWGWGGDIQPDELYLYGWFVQEKWRGRGIGRALMEYALEQTRLAGLEKLAAHVRQDDAVARALLTHFDFREIGARKPPRRTAHPGLALMVRLCGSQG